MNLKAKAFQSAYGQKNSSRCPRARTRCSSPFEDKPGLGGLLRIFRIFHPGFSESCTHHFHHHSPTVFRIMHPPLGLHFSVSSSLLPPWQPSGLRSIAEAIDRWLDFRRADPFPFRSLKRSRLEGRGCIFSTSPMVQRMAFGPIFGADPARCVSGRTHPR